MEIKTIEKELYKLSLKAAKQKEIPISAVIVYNNKIIAKAYNKKNINNNALLHAEIICLQKAYKKLHTWNLSDCEMYVTLKPCEFCKILIEESRIKKVRYILEKSSVTNKYNKTKYIQMYDIDNKYNNILKNFFKTIRK